MSETKTALFEKLKLVKAASAAAREEPRRCVRERPMEVMMLLEKLAHHEPLTNQDMLLMGPCASLYLMDLLLEHFAEA